MDAVVYKTAALSGRATGRRGGVLAALRLNHMHDLSKSGAISFAAQVHSESASRNIMIG
jgi:hypothetical protein